MWKNQNQSYDDGVYHTPQYRLDAINRDKTLPPASIQEEYLYAPANTPQLPASQSSEKEPKESRPKKQVIQHIYDDENVGYSLAANPGPETNYDRIIKKEKDREKNSESSNKKKPKCCTKNCTIICLIVVILALGGFGGLLAYVVIKEKGRETTSAPDHKKELGAEWIVKKDTTIKNSLLLRSESLRQCDGRSTFCYWEDLDIAKRECREWVNCGMIKESDKEPPTLSGIPIFWAVMSTATLMDTESLIGDNLWICDNPDTINVVLTTTPITEPTGDCSCSNFVANSGFGNCQKVLGLGPICYVNEPTTCTDVVNQGSDGPTGYSWEACVNPHTTCPEYNTDYHGNDIISFENAFKTSTWVECGQRCRAYSSCTHWTWLKEGFTDDKSHWNKCLLKTARQNVGVASLHISGDRTCG